MERFLRICWLLLIPTQLGRHFWLEESSVWGVRIDYLSLILYLGDVVWLGWIIWNLKNSGLKLKKGKIFQFENLVLLLFIVVNIIMAKARWVALYRWLRLGQWWLTTRMITTKKKEIRQELGWIVPIWLVGEAFLGLAQVVKGGSLNGIWWALGERRFNYGGVGIAQISVLGEGLVRAYGTFSHPNSLAGFLLLAWWWWKINLPPIPFFNKTGRWIVNWSTLMGVMLAGSRTVWGLGVGLLLGEQIWKNRLKFSKEIVGKIVVAVGVVGMVLGVVNNDYQLSKFLGGWDSNGWEKRESLAVAAVRMIKESPLFGMGAGNFVVRLPEYQNSKFYWQQPVHNIFLLIWAEIGLLGIILLGINFRWLVIKVWQKKYWWWLVIVGVTGMVDHYWLTLPQNNWLLAVILGIM